MLLKRVRGSVAEIKVSTFALFNNNLQGYVDLVDVSIFCSEAPGRGGVGLLLKSQEGGVSQQMRGRPMGLGACLGAKYFFPGPKFPPSL